MGTPKIYVACLASYTNGILHGEWIDAAQDPEILMEEITEKVIETSPIPDAEEWAIHDYEGFEGMNLHEYEDLHYVSKLALAIEEYGEAFAVYVANLGGFSVNDDIERQFEDAFVGIYDSEVDYAYEYVDGVLDIPENIAPYFDYESYARDLFINDYTSLDVDGGIAVFMNI